MHDKSQGDFRLTCLEFGDSYLMIESAPPFPKTAMEKTFDQNPTKIRFNVSDVEAALKIDHASGIEAQIHHFDWGSTVNLTDPDGNRVGIRDEQGFDHDNAIFRAAPTARDPG